MKKRMQTLDIDLLIDLVRQRPEAFESMTSLLIQDAIQSCDKPDLGYRLQAAIASFQRDPKAHGANRLRSTIAEMHHDLGLLGDHAPAPGNAQERKIHG